MGLKSAAITFEKYPKAILSTLSAISVICFTIGGYNACLGSPYYYGLATVALHYMW